MSVSASVEIVFGLDRVSVEIEFRGWGWRAQIIAVGVGGICTLPFKSFSKMH